MEVRLVLASDSPKETELSRDLIQLPEIAQYVPVWGRLGDRLDWK